MRIKNLLAIILTLALSAIFLPVNIDKHNGIQWQNAAADNHSDSDDHDGSEHSDDDDHKESHDDDHERKVRSNVLDQ